MHDDETTFSLSSRNADVRPVLLGVDAHGRIQGVLFELTLRQTYRNDSDQVLEVIYTFLVPPSTAVLGFATTLNAVVPGESIGLVSLLVLLVPELWRAPGSAHVAAVGTRDMLRIGLPKFLDLKYGRIEPDDVDEGSFR
jgi:hypothetical protein